MSKFIMNMAIISLFIYLLGSLSVQMYFDHQESKRQREADQRFLEGNKNMWASQYLIDTPSFNVVSWEDMPGYNNWTITDETTEYDLYMRKKSFEREQQFKDAPVVEDEQ